MSLIRDLVNNEEMEYISGKFTSESLFNGEMNIGIFSDGDITLDYAEKCIMHYNKLKNNAKICERIQKKLEKFYQNKPLFESIIKVLEGAVSDTKYMSPEEFMPVL